MRIRVATRGVSLPSEKQRLPAADESHLVSMHVALDAHGVSHSVQRDNGEASTNVGYIVLDTADVERATAIVRDLQVTSPTLMAWNSRGFRAFAAAAAIVIFGAVLLVLVARGK